MPVTVTPRRCRVFRSYVLAMVAANVAVMIAVVAGCAAPQARQTDEPARRLPSAPPQAAVVVTTAPESEPVAPTKEPTAPVVADAKPKDAPPPPPPPPPAPVRLPSGILVDRVAHRIEVPAHVAQNDGFLEQVACALDSREHESLVVIDCKASDVHAALLLAGGVPGRPGRWNADGERVTVEPPTGSGLRVRVRALRGAGEQPAGEPVERDIAEWIRGRNGAAFTGRWVFGGSRFAPNPVSWKRSGEHYVADFSGSIVGLVTFGDETVGATTVIPDLVDFEAANWEAWTERMPPSGTPATLILIVE